MPKPSYQLSSSPSHHNPCPPFINCPRKLQFIIIVSTPTIFKQFIYIYIYIFRPVDRDVFVRDLNRQLGTPSHWLPVDSCKKKRTKRRPSGRLHSDAQVSQQETPKLGTSVSEHRVKHSEGGKR